MSSLDVGDRGNDPIPQRLLVDMRALETTPEAAALVRIFKKESELEVWKQTGSGNYALLKTYPMCRWSGKLGPKKREGDRQAPEGFYEVTRGRLNPKSQYHLSFDLGYPNRLERALGYTGSNLMVHGACSSSGCFAISDDHVSEVYAIIREALRGTQKVVQVQSFPFRMTAENMAVHRDDSNYSFWVNLKQGFDAFEAKQKPPKVELCSGRYNFNAKFARMLSTNPLAACPQGHDFPNSDQDTAQPPTTVKSLPNLKDFAYADGGMHFSFRKVLARRGADQLSRMTSGNRTPVSRPKEALADPYKR